MTVVGLITVEMGREEAAGAKTLANVIFMAAHCPVYLECRVDIKEQQEQGWKSNPGLREESRPYL